MTNRSSNLRHHGMTIAYNGWHNDCMLRRDRWCQQGDSGVSDVRHGVRDRHGMEFALKGGIVGRKLGEDLRRFNDL